MSEINDFFVAFYGNTKDVRKDLLSVSELNPRLIEKDDILLCVINSKLSIQELYNVFNKNGRLFSIQKMDDDFLFNFGPEINSHFTNRDEDYDVKEENSFIQINLNEIDPEIKKEIIDELLIKFKNNGLSDNEKDILKQLSSNNE